MTKINISLQTLRGYYRGAELTHLVGPGGQHADGDSVADRGAQGCISYSLKEVISPLCSGLSLYLYKLVRIRIKSSTQE